MRLLFVPSHDSRTTTPIGGKGHQLLTLQRAHTVPEWFALPSTLFIQCLASSEQDARIRTSLQRLDESTVADVAREITCLVKQIPLPVSLSEEIARETEAIANSGFVAVRSSSADEDGSKHSFAGIHESFLYVRGATDIIARIRDVWASGYSERALLYRIRNRLPIHPVPMAVIIQRMVDAQVSGVVFTADPTTRDPYHAIISSLYGLGEGLVSAGLDADTFRYDKRARNYRVTVAKKTAQCTLNTRQGYDICERPVDPSLQNSPSLSDHQLHEITRVALAVEAFRGRPQDIEFCFDTDGKLYLLQTRDITTVDEYGPAAGNRQVWDNSNIVESYSGVTSPMTFSFIRHAYAVVYTCFSEVMGINPRTIRENQVIYRNMLGLFDGQVYYNLQNWYRLVRQFPGYAYNKAFMESMMGVKETSDADPVEATKAKAFRRYTVELPKLLGLAVRMIVRFAGLRRSVPAFQRRFDTYFGRWSSMDFPSMQPHGLMQVYLDMEKHLLRNWKTPIINDFYVMVFYGTLKACCQKWCHDENGTLQNNLICGEGNIESTKPARELMRLAAKIQRTPRLAALFQTHTPNELLTELSLLDEANFTTAAVADYLSKFGFRCVNELKLEEPSLHETPEFVYQMIANYVRMDSSQLDLTAMERHEQQIRNDAEKCAFAALTPLQRIAFRLLLRHAREGVKNRENMRFARTKIYGLLRQLIQAVGATFAREGILDAPNDIFYLTLDEVWDFVKGTAVTTRLRELAALRKSEFFDYRSLEQPPSDHFETYGMAYHRNRFKSESACAPASDENGRFLHGIGCSPGVVEGTARVVHSPRDDLRLNGEILVAARTDPGWVPLYPSVSGLLIERGSILSHSAIVAREMGLPAIVGIPNLLKHIHDNQPLRMNASTGEIEILDRPLSTANQT